ncbi:hypothetical protein CWI37_1263p0010, partial [Hamiltosporidium tvaerminnensis]
MPHNQWYSTKTRPNISNYDLELNFIQKELISRCSEANKKEEINCNKKRIFSEIKDNQSDYTFQYGNISKSVESLSSDPYSRKKFKISYKNDILNKFPNEIEKHIFSVNTSPFLPFLSTFFDGINVEFDENINEVLFLKKTNENEIYYFHKTIINDIKIRTTPKALILIENQPDFDAELFFWVIFSYKINGLKISHDNMYYSECYEKDKDYIENNLPRESLTPKLFLFSSKVLKAIII